MVTEETKARDRLIRQQLEIGEAFDLVSQALDCIRDDQKEYKREIEKTIARLGERWCEIDAHPDRRR